MSDKVNLIALKAGDVVRMVDGALVKLARTPETVSGCSGLALEMGRRIPHLCRTSLCSLRISLNWYPKPNDFVEYCP